MGTEGEGVGGVCVYTASPVWRSKVKVKGVCFQSTSKATQHGNAVATSMTAADIERCASTCSLWIDHRSLALSKLSYFREQRDEELVHLGGQRVEGVFVLVHRYGAQRILELAVH